MKRLFALLMVLMVAIPAIALAEPKPGFGVYIGLVQNSGDLSSDSSSDSGSTTYKSSGPGLGADYQFALGTTTSLSPFIEVTAGEAVTCTGCKDATVERSAMGGEFRYWFDTIFVGGRLALTSSTFKFKFDNGTESSNYSGTGIGITGGWEGESGLFVKLNFDNTSESYSKDGVTTDDSVASTRLYGGYRF